MRTGNSQNESGVFEGTANRFGRSLGLAVAVFLALAAGSAVAHDDDGDESDGFRGRGFCSITAQTQFVACQNEVRDDYLTAKAICINKSDGVERWECFADAAAERDEARQLCREQRGARRDLCGLLGEARYEPDFDPANFDDDFTNLSHPNPYFPLAIGNIWEYEAEDETGTVTVLDKTKLIEGVTCIVVNDRVNGDGFAEDTDDWFGQRKDGTVAYCGESVRDMESFLGDMPEELELVAIDGSFKAGRDGALSGTILPGVPFVGTTYRQEWSAGNAEDAATVLSTTYGYGSMPELDAFVPQALADHLCANDCVVTAEFTPIEPGVLQRKYYAHGIGLFLEVDVDSGQINRLVNCNFDARCAGLPAP